MNTKIKCYLLFLFLLLINFSYAQETNSDRMKRDIKVAENILSTLINQESNFRFGNNIEGTYIEGNGVLFTIGGNSLYRIAYGSNVTVSGYAVAPPSPRARQEVNKMNADSLQSKTYATMKIAMKTFLTDYAHLLSQLKPNEKILLRYGANRNFSSNTLTFYSATLAPSSETENLPKELTAEVTKAALDDFRNNKLTKAQLEERIKFTEQTAGGKKDTELELLSSIFNRLYQSDLSTTFRLISNANYEKIEGLGAIYNLTFGYAAKGTSGFFYNGASGGTVWSREGLEKEPAISESEWKEVATKKYPEFLNEFKENIIEYGRTVKKLNTNELLIFKLNLNFCEDCNIPRTVELSIKKSVLEDYDKNKINLNDAVAKMTVKTN